MRLFSRNALYRRAQSSSSLGAGSEFHALNEFHTGMDRRTIDWKQSARHGTCWPRSSAPSATTR